MKIIRSIAAIVVGTIVAGIVIMGIEAANGFFLFPPPEGKSMTEWGDELHKGTPAAKEWINSVPTSVHAMLQVGWCLGALVGGAVAACIAGRAHLLHAGIIGVIIVILTIVNIINLKTMLDYSHPDWLIATGVLLPVPSALLAGMLVGKLCGSTAPDATPS